MDVDAPAEVHHLNFPVPAFSDSAIWSAIFLVLEIQQFCPQTSDEHRVIAENSTSMKGGKRGMVLQPSCLLTMSKFIVKSVMQVIVRVSKKHSISLQIGLKNGSYLYQLASVTYSLLVTLALMTPQSIILTIVSYLELYPVVTLVLQLLVTCHPLSM